MKNMNMFDFCWSRLLIICFSFMTFMFTSVDSTAQNLTGAVPVLMSWNDGNVDETNVVSYLDRHIQYVQALQALQSPGTAKFDICTDAISYLNSRIAFFNANPDTDGEIYETFTHEYVLKAHPSILGNYSALELAELQTELSSGALGANLMRQIKVEYILDANAY